MGRRGLVAVDFLARCPLRRRRCRATPRAARKRHRRRSPPGAPGPVRALRVAAAARCGRCARRTGVRGRRTGLRRRHDRDQRRRPLPGRSGVRSTVDGTGTPPDARVRPPDVPPHAEAIALGQPRPMLEFLFDTGRAVSDLVFIGTLRRYPGIPWIFTHGGGVLPLLADRLELFRTAFAGAADGPTVPEQIGGLWFDIAGTPFPQQVPAFERAFGTDRLLYGSDFCWTPPAAVDAQLASIDAAAQPAGTTWRELTTGNCARLFPRLFPRLPTV
ncbi:amidohydrolase family protein [Amycolatopsis sp. NPDC051061]|uniref:amidohydrolase family protein n=1 Tax=Amycolatopsis sp. NPDC051061 TaxID=3155042 RepID=UPI00342CCFF5